MTYYNNHPTGLDLALYCFVHVKMFTSGLEHNLPSNYLILMYPTEYNYVINNVKYLASVYYIHKIYSISYIIRLKRKLLYHMHYIN